MSYNWSTGIWHEIVISNVRKPRAVHIDPFQVYRGDVSRTFYAYEADNASAFLTACGYVCLPDMETSEYAVTLGCKPATAHVFIQHWVNLKGEVAHLVEKTIR